MPCYSPDGIIWHILSDHSSTFECSTMDICGSITFYGSEGAFRRFFPMRQHPDVSGHVKAPQSYSVTEKLMRWYVCNWYASQPYLSTKARHILRKSRDLRISRFFYSYKSRENKNLEKKVSRFLGLTSQNFFVRVILRFSFLKI